jgi:hypothetical protein
VSTRLDNAREPGIGALACVQRVDEGGVDAHRRSVWTALRVPDHLNDPMPQILRALR